MAAALITQKNTGMERVLGLKLIMRIWSAAALAEAFQES
jgi:hypothetical protein